MDAVDYTTSADVKVHQDSMYSLVGNIGTAVGYKFSDKGNVYARASLVKEFQGDIDTGIAEKTEQLKKQTKIYQIHGQNLVSG